MYVASVLQVAGDILDHWSENINRSTDDGHQDQAIMRGYSDVYCWFQREKERRRERESVASIDIQAFVVTILKLHEDQKETVEAGGIHVVEVEGVDKTFRFLFLK